MDMSIEGKDQDIGQQARRNGLHMAGKTSLVLQKQGSNNRTRDRRKKREEGTQWEWREKEMITIIIITSVFSTH